MIYFSLSRLIAVRAKTRLCYIVKFTSPIRAKTRLCYIVKFTSPIRAKTRGRMHKSSCGHLRKRRSNSPRRVLENKFIFTNLLSNGIGMMLEVKKVVWLILIVIIKMSMASTRGNFVLQNCWSSLCQLHKMELD